MRRTRNSSVESLDSVQSLDTDSDSDVKKVTKKTVNKKGNTSSAVSSPKVTKVILLVSNSCLLPSYTFFL